MAVTKRFIFQECSKCHQSFGSDGFTPTKNPFYSSGFLPICNNCLVELVEQDMENWTWIDKICQYIDVPFIPSRWEELSKTQGARAIVPYCKIFQDINYEQIDWAAQQKIYIELEKEGTLSSEVIPKFNDKQLMELKMKWGANYDEEELYYLEMLYNGVMTTQSVNGALQTDQALKLCKLSLIIDSRIREGGDVDKMLGSYEKLVKIAEFTPKNVKNAQDFDSVGELFAYLEKLGWENPFYDDVKRDIVDATMANIQKFCQKLYTNEPGIGDDIDKRIEALKNAKELEDSMGLMDDYTGDDVSARVDEMMDEIEEFNPEVE